MNIWKFIQKKLTYKTDVMLLLVADSNGSSPGKPGFKMVVSKKKELLGSIGGGEMEFQMVELAYEILNSGKHTPFCKQQYHSKGHGTDESGAICSGTQTIVFFPLNIKHLPTINKIIQSFDSSVPGSIQISNSSFDFIADANSEIPVEFYFEDEYNWSYKEMLGKNPKICIIGAGHVGHALSKIMKDLNFIVEIYDDRLGLNTFENNVFVNKKHKINYNYIDALLPQGDDVYVVIMTFGHQSDELVLDKIVNMNFKYIGMMGSNTKVEKIFKNIGYNPDKENINKVHAPIGISINSHTPVEIAISIAAEIIKIKNN
jgi:xanthine dehydrogenase accessory factor